MGAPEFWCPGTRTLVPPMFLTDNMKNRTPPETAIIYAVKKQIVTTISTAGTILLSWNKEIIFHGYKVENYHCKMKSYPKFPFSHPILFDFPLISSQLDSFSSNVGSFIADQKVENMCLEDQLLKCKYCYLFYPDNWKHKSKYTTNRTSFASFH